MFSAPKADLSTQLWRSGPGIKMSMQIVEKSNEGLSRVYGVTVPAADLGERLAARIKELAPQMKLKGFRPGKVPVAHVKRVYGKALMGEVLEATLNETTKKVLEDNNLRPATQPDLKPSSDMDKVMDGSADLSYDLSLEVMPDFEPVDIATLELSRPVYLPSDAEVEEALAELAKQSRTYETRKGKSPKAADGDQLLVDFVGRIDGEAFEGGSATDAELVLGSGQFIPGFEEQLVGAKPYSTVILKVTFPEDYQAEALKGKAAEFEVTVKEVRAPVEGKADDALAERVGLADLDALTKVLRTNLEGQYANASRLKVKRALLDALDKAHDIQLPQAMVEAEFTGIWQQVEADKTAGNLTEDDAGKSDDELKVEYRKIAERRVRLGLVLAEIGRRGNVAVSDQEVMQAMQREAMQYGAQAQQIFEFLRNNQNAQAQIRAPLYEEKVVDLILGQAKVTDKPVTKEELAEEDDLPEGY
jgi:trigger factor